MATPTKSTTPARKKAVVPVAFDIEAAESELEVEELPPFNVRCKGGKLVTLKSPAEIGWQRAAVLDPREPFLMLRELLSEDDYVTFLENDFPSPLLGKLVTAYQEHYKVDEGN